MTERLTALLAQHWPVGVPGEALAALRRERFVPKWQEVSGTRADFMKALKALRDLRSGLRSHARASATSAMKKLAAAIAEDEAREHGWSTAQRRARVAELSW